MSFLLELKGKLALKFSPDNNRNNISQTQKIKFENPEKTSTFGVRILKKLHESESVYKRIFILELVHFRKISLCQICEVIFNISLKS